ncbi:amidase [Peribacillus muralis]|uniref:amidase n=1 Tax=Peribacillus muralis TaxID=264697 RepID=UPI00070EFFE6|nr:amidase [Peribacillus muralis]
MILTIKELMDGYKNKQFSPTEITKWYIDRIKRLDPIINSYITITEETAFNQAEQAEKKMNSGELSGLLGVPISYKDSIDTKDILTTGGSIIDKDRIPTENAEVVTKLEQEGIILLGKNNMFEYGFGITSKNTYFGDIVNPWNKDKTAGGSSGGSAAAVAANLSLGSICTDAAGSIRVPAACCGVVGLKPTYNLISMNGMTPLSWTLDHVGPIARNVEDTALIMEALTNKQYTTAISGELTGMRIGLPKHYFNEFMDSEVKRLYENAVQQLSDLGAVIVEIDTSFLSDIINLAKVFGTSESSYVHKERIQTSLHMFSEDAKSTFTRSKGITAFDYITALKKREELTRKVSDIFADVDVMITPTTPVTTSDVHTEQVTINGMTELLGDCMIRYVSLFNITGHPALNLPAGITQSGIPVGLQFIAGHYREDQLFQAANSYEKFALSEFYIKRDEQFKRDLLCVKESENQSEVTKNY